eukprot:COSAG01_NODE_1530_length_9964_cov_5.649879_8_plen_85_part_00
MADTAAAAAAGQQRLPQPREGLLKEIEHPTMGRTVCAAVRIERGELVISEPPLLVAGGLRALPRRTRRMLRQVLMPSPTPHLCL